jgi:hypothetical protein
MGVMNVCALPLIYDNILLVIYVLKYLLLQIQAVNNSFDKYDELLCLVM